ncbi:MAG: hypothetical protein IJK46_06285 [Prevotella sp.]|nr:hypothetical protein [Prevotella sp.]
MRKLLFILFFVGCYESLYAQDFNEITPDGNITNTAKKDTLGSNKEAPRGFFAWTVDKRFGDRTRTEPDTLQYMYMNSIFTEGKYGEYNTLGNLGSPRLNRIFADRQEPQQFYFTQPYDFFITEVDQFHFINTLSPITNITFQECGDKNNGEDHFKAKFAVNAGKRISVGFNFNYIYGRGYYQNQSTAHFNYSMYGAYLGDRYEAQMIMSTNHQKTAENGGIRNDEYITHPEQFTDNFETYEIPTFLSSNWNRLDHHHIFFTHRYNVGFNRKIPMTPEEIKAKKFAMESAKEKEERDAIEKARRKALKKGEDFDEEAFLQEREEQKKLSGRPDDAKIAGEEPADIKIEAGERIKVDGAQAADSLLAASKKEAEDTAWYKNEYVPVTSFIHTLNWDYAHRIYQSYLTPDDYYLHQNYYDSSVLHGDSIYDPTRHYSLKNTVALSLLEGFNKWAKAGLKAFATHELRHFTLPDSLQHGVSYNEHNISIGGQLVKAQGNMLHYNVTAETFLVGEDAGQIKVDANVDVNIPFWGDTIKIEGKGFYHRLSPTFYQRHFHSKHIWWDNSNLEKETRSRIEGVLSYPKTRTKFRVVADDLKNYIYFAHSYLTDNSDGSVNLIQTDHEVTLRQETENIALLTLQLQQNFVLGPINWENVITYQKCSNKTVLPLPDFNFYSNLYLKFRIAKVLDTNIGADIRYFTKYYVPDYNPLLGQFTIQNNGENNIELGNYPWINVYANLKLKQARFYVMMSHVNYTKGAECFLVPHYPTNQMILRLGVSWNFFN